MKSLSSILFLLLLPLFFVGCEEEEDAQPSSSIATTSTPTSKLLNCSAIRIDTLERVAVEINSQSISFRNIYHSGSFIINPGLVNIIAIQGLNNSMSYPQTTISFYDTLSTGVYDLSQAFTRDNVQILYARLVNNQPVTYNIQEGQFKICKHDTIKNHIKASFYATAVNPNDSTDLVEIGNGQLHYVYDL